MYTLFETKKFCKSLRRISNLSGGKKIVEEIKTCLSILQTGKGLPVNYKDHSLKGDYQGFKECHIRGDILLVYKIVQDKMVIVLVEVGSHSYLF